jgi:hypothetical protein
MFSKTIKALPLILFIFVIVFSGYTAYYVTYNFTDSDASSELVLGKLLADQNKIATTDFSYSTEVRLFNLNLIYMPLFKVFSNWHTVRFIGILLMQAMLMGSYLFLSRQMKMSTRAFFLTASLMLLPINVLYGRFVLYQNHYIPTFIFSILIAGFFLSFLRHKGQKRLWQAMRLFVLFVLAFASCLNGFRQLPAVMIPLFFTALIVAVKNYHGAPSTLISIPKRSWIQTVLAAAVLTVGLAGLWIHIHVLSQYYSFRMMDNSTIALPTAEHFRDLLVGYFSLFGFQEGRTLFSIEGILSLGGVFAAVVFFIISLCDLVPRTKPENSTASFMGVFYPIAILTMTINFILIPGNENYPQYYLPVFLWIFPYIGFLIDQNIVSIRTVTLKQALIVLACLCLALNGVFYNLYFLNPDDKQVQYDINIPYDTEPSLEGVSEFLIENDYQVGYASFWLANVMTEMTNGQIPMICISFDYSSPGDIYYYDYLTYRQTRDKDFVKDKDVFFLVANVELSLFNNSPISAYAIQVYKDKNVSVYTFDFDTEVWDYLLQQAQKGNQLGILEQLALQD